MGLSAVHPPHPKLGQRGARISAGSQTVVQLVSRQWFAALPMPLRHTFTLAFWLKSAEEC